MFIKKKKFISYNDKLNLRGKELRNNMTVAEKKLWYEYFRGHKYRFVRQKVIGNYIIDFYCQKLKLGIEVDGETHVGDKNEEYDRKRTEELVRVGIKILRFWNYDILDSGSLGEVESAIEKEISERRFSGQTKPPSSPLFKGDKKECPPSKGGVGRLNFLYFH